MVIFHTPRTHAFEPSKKWLVFVSPVLLYHRQKKKARNFANPFLLSSAALIFATNKKKSMDSPFHCKIRRLKYSVEGLCGGTRCVIIKITIDRLHMRGGVFFFLLWILSKKGGDAYGHSRCLEHNGRVRCTRCADYVQQKQKITPHVLD